MADEPETPEAELAPEAPTEQQPEDLTGLKSALETERSERKRLAKEAKANADKLAQFEQAAMSETEKAIAKAKAEGIAETAKTYATRLAHAELKAEAAAKGVDLSELGDLIDVSKLLTEDGNVDSKAVKAAVGKLAKLAPAPQGAPRGGGDFGGGPNLPPASLDAQIADAEKRRDWNTVIRLKRQKAAQNT